MRVILLSLLMALAAAESVVQAKPPVKPQPRQFMQLVSSSPFTIKPTSTGPVVLSPLETEWSLGSIRPVGGGHAVTLINKKNRKERIRFMPGYPSGDFKLLQVNQDPKSSKLSKVQISKNGQKGWISYDEKVVAVRVSAANKAVAQKKVTPKTTTRRPSPPIPGKTGTKTKPRVRHVPRK